MFNEDRINNFHQQEITNYNQSSISITESSSNVIHHHHHHHHHHHCSENLISENNSLSIHDDGQIDGNYDSDEGDDDDEMND